MIGLICAKSMMPCQTPGMCAPHGGCQPERGFEAQHLDLGKFIDWVYALKTERDQLKAESEALRKDAERYRWLLGKFRFSVSDPGDLGKTVTGLTFAFQGSVRGEVSESIDAAKSKENSHG